MGGRGDAYGSDAPRWALGTLQPARVRRSGTKKRRSAGWLQTVTGWPSQERKGVVAGPREPRHCASVPAIGNSAVGAGVATVHCVSTSMLVLATAPGCWRTAGAPP